MHNLFVMFVTLIGDLFVMFVNNLLICYGMLIIYLFFNDKNTTYNKHVHMNK